jgi:elongation factor G
MPDLDPRTIRNVGFVGHASCGKTSLVEAILFDTKVINRLGRVDEGNTVTDFEPEEIKRRKSLSTAFAQAQWKKHLINLIDTPGDSNFFGETILSFPAMDGVVIVIEAIDGVKVQTEKAWGLVKELNLPCLIFINKMDRERASFEKTVEDIKSILRVRPLILQIPMGKEDSFRGVVDLISMKAIQFTDSFDGKMQIEEVPEEMKEITLNLRATMIEDIAEVDDSLLERYLEGEEIDENELSRALHQGVISRSFVPIFCGSAYRNIGIQPLLDGIVQLLPSPVERGSVEMVNPATGEKIMRSPSNVEPFSAVVFKTIADPYAGKLSVFRVFSGQLKGDSTVFNVNRKLRERIGQIFLIEGKNQRQIDVVGPGAIAAVAKLKETKTGDTLCDEKSPSLFKMINPPPSTFSFAIKPKTREDEDKATSSLAKLTEEDPTLNIYRDEQTKELILQGKGQAHLEVAIEKLKRKFGIEVDLRTPKVPYMETIKTARQGVIYRHKKQTGGRGQFAEVHFDISPLPRGEGYQFVENLTGMNVPRNFVPAVEKGVLEAKASGVLAGYPVTDIKVRFYDGKAHEVDSSEIAFKIAASMCFKKGVSEANPVLLEPIMNLEVIVPEEVMGEIIGDLNSRRGRIIGMEDRGQNKVIKAQVPLAEVLMYEPDLTSITSGRGSFSMELSHYEEVPSHLSEKIIAMAKREKEGL